MKAPQEIIALVERFDQNLQAYQSGKYNETQLRREFIDPFFKALGWDVENTSGYAEAYKDVIHEDAIKIGSASKAPDYSFRVGGTRKFFVEAKKPSINIAEDIGPAYQLRRYAWSAKLPLSILSDFEEFAVYDCRVKPDKSDKASTARIIYLKYKEYLTRWEEIASVFSKDALMKGSFDKYAETTKTKRGTAGVDAAFLSEIDSWRQALAQNIALRNLSLTQRELNFAVTKTIDRIIFLRICEDRGIEPYGRLMALQNGADVYQRLTKYFYDADDKYNSGLFHFRREKDRFEPPDDLTLTLSVDDKILKDIFKSLYYPESPYEFSVLPADILGQVYEQFLGKVIHLTPGHRARVEEKPEVRKAGGVYYTPTYIVDYIVKNTVGKLLEGKTPKAVKKLRILDPACGSGSFLIGAYQYLLDWHRDKYIEDGAEKHAKGKDPKLYQRIRNEWRLTTAERKRILLNNIYGVDIDPQAVEVTKLSLLLKVLEGESDETIKSAFRLFNERALPDLGNNIKCGNSLIGPDFYEGQQTSFLDTEEMQRVNAFDWEREFPEIFKAGGFDAVIGNPPYIDSEWLTKTNPELRSYCTKNYQSAKGNWDIFCVFVEKGLELSRQYSSLITPNKLLSADYARAARNYMVSNHSIIVIRDYSNIPVFPVSVYPIVYVAKTKTTNLSLSYELMKQTEGIIKIERSQSIDRVKFNKVDGNSWTSLFGGKDNTFLEKFEHSCILLGEIASVNGAATVSEAYEYKEYIADEPTKEDYFIFVNTGTIDRYAVLWGIYPTTYIKAKYNRPIIPRKFWHKMSERRLQQARSEKIIVGGMNKRLECIYDSGNIIAGKSTSIIISNKVNLLYLLGLLNSKLLSYFYRTTFSGLSLQGGFLRIGPPQLKILPIKTVENTDPDFQKMINLVEQMLSLNKQLTEAKTDHDQTLIQRQIDATDNQIDKLVYGLYDLTPEEIAIVERSI